MVEQFLEEGDEEGGDEPPPISNEPVLQDDEPLEKRSDDVYVDDSLEELVEEQVDSIFVNELDKLYFEGGAVYNVDYFQPDEVSFNVVPELKQELKPLVYEDNEVVLVLDIFDKYGVQKEDDWWKKKSLKG